MKIMNWVFCKIRFFLFAGMVMGLTLQGCIKDKYDFNKLSTQAKIGQQWALPIVYGSMKMENMVKPNDTIVFEDNGAVKVVYRQDSIFSLAASDYMKLEDQDPDSTNIALGPFHLNDFHTIKNIPNTTGTSQLPFFQTFTHVTFAGGTVSVTVTNNLSTEITSLTLRLHNTGDHTVIGSDLVYSNIAAHNSMTRTFDLAGLTTTHAWSVEVVSIAPAVTVDPDGLTISILSTNVSALSGNAIIPDQVFYHEAGNYDLNQDTIQLTLFGVRKGLFAVTVNSPLQEHLSFNITFPTGKKNADTLAYSFVTNGSGTYEDTLHLAGAIIDLGTDPAQPYNTLPYRYRVSLVSSGNLVDFDVTQVLKFKYQMKDLAFQTMQGYFGEKEYVFDKDTLDVGLDDFFSNIKGTLSLTNPQVNILYANGFGIPAEIALDVTGKTKSGKEQALNAPPMRIQLPANSTDPPVDGVLAFTKDNTDIVKLIDLHPSTILYGGKAAVNPDGFQGWTNFISYNSSIVLGLEVEVPLEFKMQDLQLQDTIDNPFFDDQSDSSDFSLRNFKDVKLRLKAENGFPVGMSFRVYIYEKTSGTILDSVLFNQIIQAAPVDAEGRVTEAASSDQTVEINEIQLNELANTPDLIVAGVFNSSDGGAKSVKIYTDYTFDFKLGVQTRLNYEFDLGDGNNMNNF